MGKVWFSNYTTGQKSGQKKQDNYYTLFLIAIINLIKLFYYYLRTSSHKKIKILSDNKNIHVRPSVSGGLQLHNITRWWQHLPRNSDPDFLRLCVFHQNTVHTSKPYQFCLSKHKSADCDLGADVYLAEKVLKYV